MKIYSTSINNGYLDDAFGHRGSQILKGKMPNRSFHLGWENLPAGTQSLAVVFIDYDAVPVCGFPWIHWTVANIDPALGELSENASLDKQLLEGVNSWNSGLLSQDWHLDKDDATAFGGCAPPDKDHLYNIEVYALDTKVNVSRSFYLNELYKAMSGHVLDHKTLQAWYKTK